MSPRKCLTTGRLLDGTKGHLTRAGQDTVFPLKDKADPTRKISGKTQTTAHNSTDFGFTKEDLKPGTKITIQPPSQLRIEPQGKRKTEGQPEGSYEGPRRGEEGTTLEDKMPEDSSGSEKGCRTEGSNNAIRD